MKKMDLSIILPAYNVSKNISRNCENLIKTLKSLTKYFEIIYVNDGSSDQTLGKIKFLKLKHPKEISIITYKKNMGKGYAVRTGFTKAKGKIIGFIDADGDIEPKSLKNLYITLINKNADIVIGSKNHLESKIDYPLPRRIVSYFSQLLIKLLLNLNVTDTQAGIKLFKKNVLKKILPILKINGYAFDIEILAFAKKSGFTKIYESPIEVKMNNEEKLNILNLRRFVGELNKTFIELINIKKRL